MDIYILKPDLSDVEEMIQDYESFIWTERYSNFGDFELVLKADSEAITNFRIRHYIKISETDRFMRTDRVETLREGRLKVSGRSFDSFLTDRYVDDFRTMPFSDHNFMTVYDIVSELAYQSLSPNKAPAYNSIANFSVPWLSQEVRPSLMVAPSWPKGNLYTTIKGLIDSDDAGFYIALKLQVTPTANQGDLELHVHKGIDRSSAQTSNPVISLSVSNNDLENTKFVEDSTDFKNICRSYYKEGSVIVTDGNYGAYTSGIHRRILTIYNDDLTVEEDTLSRVKAQAEARGRVELKKHAKKILIDGKVLPTSSYVYGQDYFMGDIIELQDSYGNSARARVVEYIRSSDINGTTSYPSFEEV